MKPFQKMLIATAALALSPALATAQTESRLPVSSAYDVRIETPKFDVIESRAARSRLKSIWKTYSVASRYYDAAARSRSRTATARLFQRAARGFSITLDALKKWERRYAVKDVAVRLEHDRLRPRFDGARRAAHIRLANAYINRGTFQMALDSVEQVLMYHPTDVEALRLRTHTQFLLAASLKG